MNWQLLIPLLVTTSVAICGWLVGHWFNARRDQQNKRREVRVKYLIDAYQHLETASCRELIHGSEFAKGFESAIADIQLFGTNGQVQMAKALAEAIANRQVADSGPLLSSLRTDLRCELNLGPLNEAPKFLRLYNSGQPITTADACTSHR